MYDRGEEHTPQLPPSSRHSKVDEGSEELKAKEASVDVVESAGPPVSDVSGAVVSTVNVLDGLTPTLPTASDWRALTVYVPSASADGTSIVHDPAARVAVSVVTAVPPRESSTSTDVESPAAVPACPASVGVASLVQAPSAGAVTVTPGAVVSTVNATVPL